MNTLASLPPQTSELGEAIKTINVQHFDHSFAQAKMTEEEKNRLEVHNDFAGLGGAETPQRTSAEISKNRVKVGTELGSMVLGKADVETTTYRESSVDTTHGTNKHYPKSEVKDASEVNANAGFYSSTRVDVRKGRNVGVSKSGKTTVSAREGRYAPGAELKATGSVEIDESRSFDSGAESSEVYRNVTVHEDGHKTVEQTYYPDRDVDSKDVRTRTWSTASEDPKEAKIAARIASTVQKRVARRTKGKGTELAEPDKNAVFDGGSTTLTKQELGILQAKKRLHELKAPQREAEKVEKEAAEKAEYEKWSSRL